MDNLSKTFYQTASIFGTDNLSKTFYQTASIFGTDNQSKTLYQTASIFGTPTTAAPSFTRRPTDHRAKRPHF